MDQSKQSSHQPQKVAIPNNHLLGLSLGLLGGLTLDALFGFRTGTFFTFVGIVLGMSGFLDFKEIK
ncbi:hypothetical protein [Lentilactobacillus sunkii]|uniref:Uncharacterized protein n=1 Tax=Lentilactobacillus sunkii DSM 19904 TaxID=1423808 RepID=A0A0R1L798_9LACO|nr:hypothetical protein [Lentilactobacillus sunkii]KRK87351.1 hypothetical protein FD17_GL001324 [Lentilactobacillus sunkii DSM 19904]